MKVILSIISTLIFSLEMSSAVVEDPSKSIQRGINLGYNMKFDEAKKVFDQYIASGPNDPQGYFLNAGIAFWELLLNMQDKSTAEKLKEYAELAIDKSNAVLDKKPSNQDAQFMLGSAYGSLGRYHLLTKNYLRAVYYGNKAYKVHKDLVQINPEYWDAYLGVGIFEYYADMLPAVVKVFLDTDGDRENGLTAIKIAAKKGTILKSEAEFFLGQTLYLFEKEYHEAKKLMQSFIKKYPEHLIARNLLGTLYRRNGELTSAEETYADVKKLAIKKNFRYAAYRTTYFEGTLFEVKNDFTKAKDRYKQVVDYLIDKDDHKDDWLLSWSYFRYCKSIYLLNNKSMAEKCFKQIIKKDYSTEERAEEWIENKFPPFLIQVTKAENYQKSKRTTEALKAFKILQKEIADNRENFPKSAMARTNIGIAKSYYENNKLKKAATYADYVTLDKVNNKDIYLAWAHFFQGKRYLVQQEQVLAKQLFKKAKKFADRKLEIEINKELSQLKSVASNLPKDQKLKRQK